MIIPFKENYSTYTVRKKKKVKGTLIKLTLFHLTSLSKEGDEPRFLRAGERDDIRGEAGLTSDLGRSVRLSLTEMDGGRAADSSFRCNSGIIILNQILADHPPKFILTFHNEKIGHNLEYT